MSHMDDFTPKRSAAESDLAATVPDIFAPALNRQLIPSDCTCVELIPSGRLNFPGVWETFPHEAGDVRLANLEESALVYQQKDSLTAVVSIGNFKLSERAELLLSNLVSDGARALQDFELSSFHAALCETRKSTDYEINAGSIELLGNRLVLVLQGVFAKSRMKEALIIFPAGNGYGHLSLRAIKPEFPIYFDHLRHALRSVEWQ